MSKRLLLCDRDASTVALMEKVFPQYHCDIVDTAAAALARLETELPDLLVTDLNLSDMSGVAFIERLRQSQKFAELPVIVVTDGDPADLRDKLLPFRVISVLQKHTLEDASKDESASDESKGGEKETHSTVLVVARSNAERQILSRYLTQRGFRAYAYPNPEMAINAMSHLKPRVFVFDVQDCFEQLDMICTRLRDSVQKPNIVIGVSNSNNRVLHAKLLKDGVDLLLKKPLTFASLSGALGGGDKDAVPTDETEPENSGHKDHQNVLLVAASAVCARAVQTALSAAPQKYNVSVAPNGTIATHILQSHEVDLVVVDLSMSREDGERFLIQLRHAARFVPCVIISDTLSGAERSRIEKVGTGQILERPFSNEALLAMVERLINAGVEPIPDDEPVEAAHAHEAPPA